MVERKKTPRDVLLGRTFYDGEGRMYEILDLTYRGVETIAEIKVKGEDKTRKVNVNTLLSRI